MLTVIPANAIFLSTILLKIFMMKQDAIFTFLMRAKKFVASAFSPLRNGFSGNSRVLSMMQSLFCEHTW